MSNKITKEQIDRLKQLNSKLYTSIMGTSRTEILNNFEEFLQSFEDFIKFSEDMNFLIEKDNRKEFIKKLQLQFQSVPDNQDDAIIDYLKRGNTITGVEALELFRCYRLSSVIHRLRHQHGYQIDNISKVKHGIYKMIQE
jgi:hypothetical protein